MFLGGEGCGGLYAEGELELDLHLSVMPPAYSLHRTLTGLHEEQVASRPWLATAILCTEAAGDQFVLKAKNFADQIGASTSS